MVLYLQVKKVPYICTIYTFPIRFDLYFPLQPAFEYAGFVACGEVDMWGQRSCFCLGLRTASAGDGPELVLFFGLPPDHSKLGLITKTSIPVWSWSHSVRTLMRNMWSCPDTQSEETQSLSPSFSPPSSSLPPFSHSFVFTLSCFTLYIFFCRQVWSFNDEAALLGPHFFFVILQYLQEKVQSSLLF